MKVLTGRNAQQTTDGLARTRRRQRHPHFPPSPWVVAPTRVGSLPVLAQLLRLLMGIFADKRHPATARAQLQKELKAAVTAAQLEGEHSFTAATIMQHLPPARLQQLLTATAPAAAAAKRRHITRGTAGGGCGHAWQVAARASSSAAGGSDASTATSSDCHVLRASCAPAAQATRQHLTGPAAQQQPSTADWLLPSQQPIWDVGCLLETTLVAAAAEAQLASVSLDDPGSDCFMDDASSPVDVEGVMLEELELAKYNGLV